MHLAKRFATSLSHRNPDASDEAWVEARLLPEELVLWKRLGSADRRHAIAVARAAVERIGTRAERPVVAAALMHDIGKLESGLGTFGRVAATLGGKARGRDRRPANSRFARYLRHDELGAALLAEAGSDPLTVAWAREHHWPEREWTLPTALAAALKAADDD